MTLSILFLNIKPERNLMTALLFSSKENYDIFNNNIYWERLLRCNCKQLKDAKFSDVSKIKQIARDYYSKLGYEYLFAYYNITNDSLKNTNKYWNIAPTANHIREFLKYGTGDNESLMDEILDNLPNSLEEAIPLIDFVIRADENYRIKLESVIRSPSIEVLDYLISKSKLDKEEIIEEALTGSSLFRSTKVMYDLLKEIPYTILCDKLLSGSSNDNIKMTLDVLTRIAGKMTKNKYDHFYQNIPCSLNPIIIKHPTFGCTSPFFKISFVQFERRSERKIKIYIYDNILWTEENAFFFVKESFEQLQNILFQLRPLNEKEKAIITKVAIEFVTSSHKFCCLVDNKIIPVTFDTLIDVINQKKSRCIIDYILKLLDMNIVDDQDKWKLMDIFLAEDYFSEYRSTLSKINTDYQHLIRHLEICIKERKVKFFNFLIGKDKLRSIITKEQHRIYYRRFYPKK